MRVLVVDDDKIVLELASQVLSMNGFDDVTLASSGEEALAAISDLEGTFDAVLLDIQMPVMDGIEVCKAIRALPAYRIQPIIMLTAMQDKSYVNAAFAMGATDYVTKPFDPFDLGMRLERNLAKSGGRDYGDASFEAENFCREADGLVTLESLKNYLRQMKKCAVQNALFAVQVDNFDDLRSDLNSEHFESHLSHVARVLRNHLGQDFNLTTFVDEGTFLVVSEGAVARFDDMFCADLESSVNLHMSQKTRIRISEPLRCRKFKEVDVEEVVGQVLQSLERPISTQPTLSAFGVQTAEAAQ